MKTAFLCERCGERLVAKASLAGRASRCPKCGQRVVVPAAAEAADGDWRAAVSQQLDPLAPPKGSAAAHDAATEETGYRLKSLTPVGTPQLEPRAPRPASAKRTPQGTPPSAGKQAPRTSRRDPVPSGKAASPQSTEKSPPGAEAHASLADEPDDDLRGLFGDSDEVEFEFNPPEIIVAPSQMPSRSADVLRVYRSVFSLLARGTKGISEASYTISFMLLILAVGGGIMGNHGLASLGLGLIVLLNVIGFIGDLASLVMLSFRKEPMQGLLFLLPPYAAYYLWTDWKRYQEVVGRMRIPVLMLAFVAVAYAFVPWLSGGKESAAASPAVEASADGVSQDLPSDGAADAASADTTRVGYGVGLVETAAEWVWSFVGGEPKQLFHSSEPAEATPEGAVPPDAESGGEG